MRKLPYYIGLIGFLLFLLAWPLLLRGQGYDPISADYLRAWRIGAGGGAELWTPADLGTNLFLWLDAADSSTLWADTTATTAATNGGSIARWDDKSGWNRNAVQETAEARPIYRHAQINGKNIVSLERQDFPYHLMQIDPFSVSAGIRLYHVVQGRKTGEGDIRNNHPFYATTLTTISHFGGIGGNSDWYDSFFSTSRPQVSATLIPQFSTYLTFVEQTGTQIKGRVFGLIDESTANATFNASPTTYFGVAVRANSGVIPDFWLSEYVMIQSPTTNDQQKIEGYLAHKWGLTANLPSDHPYKDNPPMK